MQLGLGLISAPMWLAHSDHDLETFQWVAGQWSSCRRRHQSGLSSTPLILCTPDLHGEYKALQLKALGADLRLPATLTARIGEFF